MTVSFQCSELFVKEIFLRTTWMTLFNRYLRFPTISFRKNIGNYTLYKKKQKGHFKCLGSTQNSFDSLQSAQSLKGWATNLNSKKISDTPFRNRTCHWFLTTAPLHCIFYPFRFDNQLCWTLNLTFILKKKS